MPNSFDSFTTMFVYLKGHHLLAQYFAVSDTRMSSNDGNAKGRGVVVSEFPREPRR